VFCRGTPVSLVLLVCVGQPGILGQRIRPSHQAVIFGRLAALYIVQPHIRLTVKRFRAGPTKEQ